MQCKKCSANYEGNFCPECGEKSDEFATSKLGKAAKKHMGTKKKKPIYLRWWFIAIVIGLLIFAFNSRSEKIELEDMVLGEMIPELPNDRGEININSSETLDIDLDKISAKEYSSYTDLCKEKGYNIEMGVDSDSFAGYNEDGYNLSLYYSSYRKELSITLKAPMKLSEIEWPDNIASSQLPKPKSKIGKFYFEYDDSFFVYIGETSKTDYAEYVSACSNMGFNVDYNKGDDHYSADNNDGWHIRIEYVGNNIMSIDIDPPDEDDFDDEDVGEVTTVSTTTQTSETKATAESTTKTTNLVDGMRIEFKSAMDSYESYMKEYVEFMKKFDEDSSNLTLISQYASMMSKYADFVDDFEKWGDEEMNTAETKYYIDVQARVAKLLLEIDD